MIKNNVTETITDSTCLKETDKVNMSNDTNNQVSDTKSKTPDKWGDYTADQWWKDRDEAEKNRIMKWRQKQATQFSGIDFKADKSNDEKTINVSAHFQSSDLNDLQKAELQRATLHATTGSASESFGRLLLSQIMSAHNSDGYNIELIVNAVNDALLSMAPQDEYEGMLCGHLLALHNQSMHYMAKAAIPEISSEAKDLSINRAIKLMRAYNETLDLLNKHRRKGEQKFVVQHVNVNGGQTIVAGNFDRGGVTEKK